MLKKILIKYSGIVCSILGAVVLVSTGTISSFGVYEHTMPAHLVSNDIE